MLEAQRDALTAPYRPSPMLQRPPPMPREVQGQVRRLDATFLAPLRDYLRELPYGI